MLSSTSSSRTPAGNWGIVWVSALFAAAILGFVLEISFREAGFRPSVRDEPSYWALHRALATGSRPVVLVGASRMQLGVDPEVLSDLLERPVVQLAIGGSNPLPVLTDLANDRMFRGDVCVSLTEENFFRSSGRSGEYVEYFRRNGRNLNTLLNAVAVAAVNSRLALRSVSLRDLMGVLAGLFPRPSYVTMRRDRFRPADYSLLDIDAHREERLLRARDRYQAWHRVPPTDSIFFQGIDELREMVSSIQSRGGEVTLIRLPTGPEHWRITDLAFPRERYWDRLAREPSLRALHFRDEPALMGFHLPDESHLDYRDAEGFTRLLAEAVARLNGPHTEKAGSADEKGNGVL